MDGGPRPGGRESQGTEPAGTVSLSGSFWIVLKVAFGDTSTYVAIFIGERGRVFLNGYNFCLFPLKRNFSFPFVSLCLCFLHTSSV